MLGGQVIKEGRLRAGLSQRELAERLGTRQPVVARWERGTAEPSFDTMRRALRACGLDLEIAIASRDDDHPALIAERLRMTPAERLEALRAMLELDVWVRQAHRVGRGD